MRRGDEVTMLDEALQYAEMFHRVLPVYELLDDGTCSCTPRGQPCSQDKPGKHPRIREWQNRATYDGAQVRAWWSEWPNANIGIAVPEGTVVFDVDPRHGGDISQLGTLPETVVARSGSGGWHVWFTVPEGAILRGGEAQPGVDIRKHGNYVLVEPSQHASGGQYAWEPGRSLLEMPRAHIPEHLLKLVEQPAGIAAPSHPARRPENDPTPPTASLGLGGSQEHWLRQALGRIAYGGRRNDTGFWLATQLRDDGMRYEEAETVLRAYAAQVAMRGDHPYSEEEALASLASAFRQSPREPATRLLQVGGGGGSESAVPPPPHLRDSAARNSPPESGAPPLHRSEHEDEGIHSFIPFIHSENTDGDRAGGEAIRADLMQRIQNADAMPADGIVQHPGTNANARRRAQRDVLTEAWAYLFPGDARLSLAEVSTYLNLPGIDGWGEMVLDFMFSFRDAPHAGPLRAPRAAFGTSLKRALGQTVAHTHDADESKPRRKPRKQASVEETATPLAAPTRPTEEEDDRKFLKTQFAPSSVDRMDAEMVRRWARNLRLKLSSEEHGPFGK